MNPCDWLFLFVDRLLNRWDQDSVAFSCRGMLSKSWLPNRKRENWVDARDHGVGGGGRVCGCGCTGDEEDEEEGEVEYRVGCCVEQYGSGDVLLEGIGGCSCPPEVLFMGERIGNKGME